MQPPDHLVPILVDECVTNKVAISLRGLGFTAWHVTEVGRRGYQDHEQLEYATENGMLLLTYNIADFVELDREWRVTGRSHAGILLAPDRIYQRDPGGLVNDVRATLRHYSDVHEGSEADWLHNQVWWIIRGLT